MQKQDLVLNNQQLLICHKDKPNQFLCVKMFPPHTHTYISLFYYSSLYIYICVCVCEREREREREREGEREREENISLKSKFYDLFDITFRPLRPLSDNPRGRNVKIK